MREQDQTKCRWCVWENVASESCDLRKSNSEYEGNIDEIGGNDCPGYEKCSINKYGLMHKTFLKENEPFVWETLLLNGELEERLVLVSKAASQRLSEMMSRELKVHPAPEENGNILEVAGYKQNIKDSFEEIILKELVYNSMPFGGKCTWKLEE